MYCELELGRVRDFWRRRKGYENIF